MNTKDEMGAPPNVPTPDDAHVSRIEFEAALMRQEHRLHAILKNFFIRRWEFSKDDPRRAATTEALVWRIAAALVPAATAGGAGLVAIAGLAGASTRDI